MKAWEESDRYNYPLTENSVVMDVGAHKGAFFTEISKKARCRIFAYEPVFYKEAVAQARGDWGVTVEDYGLGKETGLYTFRRKGDMTGAWADDGPQVGVKLVDIQEEMPKIMLGRGVEHTVSLIKINIEGGEYDLLERILSARAGTLPMIRQFSNLQIQFHAIPQLNPVERWKKIRERLAETHTLEYADPSMEFTSNSWEGWSIR